MNFTNFQVKSTKVYFSIITVRFFFEAGNIYIDQRAINTKGVMSAATPTPAHKKQLWLRLVIDGTQNAGWVSSE